LVWLLVSQSAEKYRALGWAFVGVFVVLMALKAKNYYLSPAYPVVFAAGGVAFERATEASMRWGRGVYVGAVLAAGLVLAPFVLPLLPVKDFLAYQEAFGALTPVRMEKDLESRLPQQFADEFGWEEMVRETALVFNALPPSEKAGTAIFANNYGEAAAVDFFGAKYGLPKAISNHESYWLWGPRGYSGTTVIVLGSDGTGDRAHFRTVQAAELVDDPYSRRIEKFEIFLCRDLIVDLHTLWPTIRRW
jgi:hypothetical protein